MTEDSLIYAPETRASRAERANALASLYAHWMRADAIKVRIPIETLVARGHWLNDLESIAKKASQTQTSCVFYALIYVVVEGYRKLDLHDEAIDVLLGRGDYEDMLRRFRNAVFHFEKAYDPRLVEFLSDRECARWAEDLYIAFERFLTRPITASGTETPADRFWYWVNPKV